MSDDISSDWWADGPGAAGPPLEVAMSVRDARVALAAAGAALAKWRTHRQGCPRCAALAPPQGPGQACYAGRPLLGRLLAAQGRAAGARAALAAVTIARPGRLF